MLSVGDSELFTSPSMVNLTFGIVFGKGGLYFFESIESRPESSLSGADDVEESD